MKALEPGEVHHVRIRNDGLEGWKTAVEIDGVQDNTITDIKVHIPVDGTTRVTLTMLATVDIDVPADLQLESAPLPPVADVGWLQTEGA